jgi:hypothetical protein
MHIPHPLIIDTASEKTSKSFNQSRDRQCLSYQGWPAFVNILYQPKYTKATWFEDSSFEIVAHSALRKPNLGCET